MASKYSVLDFDSEEERLKNPGGPPMVNLFDAAVYITTLLSANDVPHAVMGGFAMVCRGSLRTTHDVDVVTDATMAALWRIIEPQPRLIIPDTKLLEGVLKVFVKTGVTYDNPQCSETWNIEVDLVRPGAKGSPRTVKDHMVSLPVTVSGTNMTFYGLDVFYMMRTKLRHCATRAMPRDVQDIEYFLNHEGPQVQAIADQLDQGDRESFLETAYIREQEESARAQFRMLLDC
ncbi:MAG: cysteine desulfurase [Chaenotheca gracillima]|nr:MAG: cysteine desulfurase [Chaenotheca gracillima]